MAQQGSGLVVVVAGATGTGKSRLGLELAAALGGEVLNADALQVYRGLAVTTNQLTPAEYQGAHIPLPIHAVSRMVNHGC
jgi:tRNA dimethylallyltransferase